MKSYIKIGIDTDDVVLKYNKFMKENGKKYFKKEVTNEEGYDISEIFNVTKKEKNTFWTKYISKYIFQKVEPNVRNTLEEFDRLGYETNNITARVFASHKNIVGFIFRNSHNLAWKLNNLKLNGKRYFCSEHNSDIEKALLCKSLGIDFMFEDRIHNIEKILEISPNTVVFCVNQDHNKNHEFNSERVIRVSSIADPCAKKIINDKNEFYKSNLEQFYNEQELIKKPKKKINNLPNDLKIKINSLYNKDFKDKFSDISTLKKIRQKVSYHLIYVACGTFYKLCKRPVVLNKENVPFNSGSIISVAPHINHVDHIKSGFAVGQVSKDITLNFLAANEFLEGDKITDKLRKLALTIFDNGIIYVNRKDLKSKYNAYCLMKKRILDGKNIVICPEGTRGIGIRKSITHILNFENGVGDLAVETSCPIIPISHYKNIISVGKPVIIDDSENITEKLRELHKELLNECYDYYFTSKTENEKEEDSKKKVKKQFS